MTKKANRKKIAEMSTTERGYTQGRNPRPTNRGRITWAVITSRR